MQQAITANRPARGVGQVSADDDAVLDVLFGRFRPVGKLPIDLPRSMEAVERQEEDVPRDTEDPLYEFGFGLANRVRSADIDMAWPEGSPSANWVLLANTNAS